MADKNINTKQMTMKGWKDGQAGQAVHDQDLRLPLISAPLEWLLRPLHILLCALHTAHCSLWPLHIARSITLLTELDTTRANSCPPPSDLRVNLHRLLTTLLKASLFSELDMLGKTTFIAWVMNCSVKWTKSYPWPWSSSPVKCLYS